MPVSGHPGVVEVDPVVEPFLVQNRSKSPRRHVGLGVAAEELERRQVRGPGLIDGGARGLDAPGRRRQAGVVAQRQIDDVVQRKRSGRLVRLGRHELGRGATGQHNPQHRAYGRGPGAHGWA